MADVENSSLSRALRRRLVGSAVVAAGAVVAASLLVPSYGQSARDASGLLQKQHTAAARTKQAAAAEAKPHVDAPVTVDGGGLPLNLDGHAHNHNDPLTKNSVSRTTGAGTTADTQDPTTPLQAAIDAASVVRQRSRAGPEARAAAEGTGPEGRAAGPLRDGQRLLRPAGGPQRPLGRPGRQRVRRREGAARQRPAAALPGDRPREVPALRRPDRTSSPGDNASGRSRLRRDAERGRRLDRDAQRVDVPLPAGRRARSRGRPRRHAHHRHSPRGSGCTRRPAALPGPRCRTTSPVAPFKGVSKIQEVRGLVDAHTHGMAFEFLGGDVHCGRPWHPYGVDVRARRTAPTTTSPTARARCSRTSSTAARPAPATTRSAGRRSRTGRRRTR